MDFTVVVHLMHRHYCQLHFHQKACHLLPLHSLLYSASANLIASRVARIEPYQIQYPIAVPRYNNFHSGSMYSVKIHSGLRQEVVQEMLEQMQMLRRHLLGLLLPTTPIESNILDSISSHLDQKETEIHKRPR